MGTELKRIMQEDVDGNDSGRKQASLCLHSKLLLQVHCVTALPNNLIFDTLPNVPSEN
jgi:hypothetical protein